jgi:hypothetical protein
MRLLRVRRALSKQRDLLDEKKGGGHDGQWNPPPLLHSHVLVCCRRSAFSFAMAAAILLSGQWQNADEPGCRIISRVTSTSGRVCASDAYEGPAGSLQPFA